MHFKRTLAIVAGLTLSAAAQRLPHTAVPEHYQLTFTPHFSTNTFSGDETIDMRVLQRGAALSLNAAEIEIQTAELSSGAESQTAKVTFDKAKEQVKFTVPKPLAAGAAKIHILYTGHLNDQLRGLYLSTENGRSIGCAGSGARRTHGEVHHHAEDVELFAGACDW